MTNYRTLAAKHLAMLLAAGFLSMAAHAWAAPPPGGGAGERFKQTDKDGNGLLSRSEADQIKPWLAINFDAIDANKDGELSREEIRTFMRSRCQRQSAGAN
jgi:hypothetical protein